MKRIFFKTNPNKPCNNLKDIHCMIEMLPWFPQRLQEYIVRCSHYNMFRVTGKEIESENNYHRGGNCTWKSFINIDMDVTQGTLKTTTKKNTSCSLRCMYCLSASFLKISIKQKITCLLMTPNLKSLCV